MSAAEHREVERKYDVSADCHVPDLTRVDGVAAVTDSEPLDQVATYFDSSDLRLLRARVTLRRRTGGSDDGWHAKLPVDGDHRQELHLPLSAESSATPPEEPPEVPPELLDRLQVHLRGGTVAPVAELRTHREVRRLLDADGRVLAEMCDDRVHGVSGTEDVDLEWREWEVELVDGPPGLLDAAEPVLLAAGARPAAVPSKLARVLGDVAGPPDPAGDGPGPEGSVLTVMAAYLSEHLARLREQDRLLRSGDQEGVHQMRVAARRLRSALATYRPVLAEGATDDLRTELKWLGGVLGEARDAQVLRSRLTALVDAQPVELVLGPVRTRIDDELSAAFQIGREAALVALDDERYFELLDGLEALVADPPPAVSDSGAAGEPKDRAVATLVARDARRVRRRARSVGSVAPDERDAALHEVRKAAKRLRYAAESARPVYGKRAKKLAKRAKAVQSLLGEHQDTVVARRTLRDLGVGAHLAGENGFTFGRLHALEEQRAARLEEEYADVLARLPLRRVPSWLGD